MSLYLITVLISLHSHLLPTYILYKFNIKTTLRGRETSCYSGGDEELFVLSESFGDKHREEHRKF